jgi:hypothetical protein
MPPGQPVHLGSIGLAFDALDRVDVQTGRISDLSGAHPAFDPRSPMAGHREILEPLAPHNDLKLYSPLQRSRTPCELAQGLRCVL